MERRVGVALGASMAVMVLIGPGLVPGVAAQEGDPPALVVGGGVEAALLVGQDGSDHLDGGLGPHLWVGWRFGERELLLLRAETTWLWLTEDRGESSRADNRLLSVGGSVEVGRRWARLRPFAGLRAGVVWSRWSGEVSGGRDRDGSEMAGAWGGYGGIDFTVVTGERPVGLRIETGVLDPGELEFGRAPDPRAPDEPIGVASDDVAALFLRIGVSVGL